MELEIEGAQRIENPQFIAFLQQQLLSFHLPHGFPGGQPVSLSRLHTKLLLEMDYLVCEKTDGIRFLLYYTESDVPDAFLIDRNWSVWGFRGLALPSKTGSWHKNTLLDGELISNDDAKWTFMIFDCLLFEGHNVCQSVLTERLKCIQNGVIGPFVHYQPSHPFDLRLKTMYKPYGIAELLDKVIPEQPHPNDGLIFTPVNEPYRSGTWPHLLKWKPEGMNTVDFHVEPDGYTLAVGERGIHRPFAKLAAPAPSNAIGKIVECSMVDGNEWKFIRLRPDKQLANDIRVAENIIESIRDNVTKDELYRLIPEMRRRWKEREGKDGGRQ
jgi:mRNA guanylyltransferase